MPLADLDGTPFHFQLEGDPALPTVVFSNSLGADLSMWDAQIAALLPHFRVLRYDTRGHGQSAMPAQPTTLAALGQDLLALLNKLSLAQVHLCGVSLGGLTAMWVALHARGRLLSLVLSNTAAKIGDAEAWDQRIAAVQTGGLAAIVDAVPVRWFTPAFLANPARFAPQEQMLVGCSVAGYVAASKAIRDSDLRAEISSIKVPTLILSGAADLATTSAQGRALQTSISGSVFQTLPGAHLCNIEFPAAYNRALVPFLLQQTNNANSRTRHG